ncbi:hypothetical protein KC333_g8015 [Hortaea werneckii]|nr:hypothetical protein KC333_g8015 [Hortaea werneckii]KAI7314230.1 hypothetical protein KC326_g5133 [Hortaea werneckii]
MLFHSEDLEVYLKPHGHSSESFRLCEEPGIEIGKTFKTAWVYTRWETDRMFDIVIRFRENFDLGSANVVQIDIRAGLGQTNHCFNDAAVFAIQTSWVKGQQHVISSFAAETYDSTCCPDLQANGAGKPIFLSERFENVGQGSSKNDWAFLIRPMEEELVWGEAEKGDWFDRDTTPGNITVYVTRGVVAWDQTDGVDSNPAERRVCSPKSMKRFKALPGQEGDPYIAEFRPLASSKRPVSWPETEDITDDNGRPKMPPGYKGGFVVQGDVDFVEARRRTQDIRRSMSSEWKARKAVGSDRRTTRSSSGGGQSATQSTIAQEDEIGESGGSPSRERVPSTSATVQHPRVSEASDSSVQPTPSRAVGFANGSDSPNVGASSAPLPQKRKRSSQPAEGRKSGSVEPRPLPMVELPITGQRQSPEASSLQDGGETMDWSDFLGNQANEHPGTVVSDGQMGDNGEDSLDHFARDSPAPLPQDSSVQLAEDSPVQFAGDKAFSRVSVSSSILSYQNGPPMQDRANEPSRQRAAIAEMICGTNNANVQIGLGTHPTEDGNLRAAAESTQQIHMSLEHNPNEVGETYTENQAQRADTMLGLPTGSPYTDQHVKGYPTSTLQQRLLPTVDQDNGITDGQYEQAHNHTSLDRGQECRGEQYATPASLEGSHQRRDSLMPGRRTTANTPAPSAESARSSNKRPALQMGIIDLTNSDDESPSSAIKRPTNQSTTDSDEEDEEELAEIQRKRQMLKKEMEDLRLQKQEDEVLKRMSRRARRAVKSEPSAIVKSEQ